MINRLLIGFCFATYFFVPGVPGKETLPTLGKDALVSDSIDMWEGFDPRKEPIELEVLKEWEDDGVILQVLRYRIGVFKGKKVMMAGVYGYPKGAKNIPGLLQIHGGGQYADYKAPLFNARREYATLSIAWAGRISAPGYRVSPNEVKLFWDGKIKDSNYKLTTDWGVLDAYHAPSRNGKDAFSSIPVADWSLDPVESPRNNSWFLITLAARRGLTFLERQPQVDSGNLGVYGHSMGGKLTVLTSGSDKRVKAAAPSCGGISDRYSSNPMHLATVSDPPNLKKITCPIIFLSPSNDFHGRINDLESALGEIQSNEWRLTCSPHHNHQDTPDYEVNTQLWFDQYLKKSFSFPESPELNLVLLKGKPPMVTLKVDQREMISIDIFYTQHGQVDGKKDNSTNTKNRFWQHVDGNKIDGVWTAELPVFSARKPLWAYANVTYKLEEPVTAAGYYYGIYNADRFVISSVMRKVSPSVLESSGVVETLEPQETIEDFKGNWRKEWFTYKPAKWGFRTHKLYSPIWSSPKQGRLCFDVRSQMPNKLTVGIDSFATEISISGKNEWNSVVLASTDFQDAVSKTMSDWNGVKELRFDDMEKLRPPRGSNANARQFGATWKGKAPEFRKLRWVVE